MQDKESVFDITFGKSIDDVKRCLRENMNGHIVDKDLYVLGKDGQRIYYLNHVVKVKNKDDLGTTYWAPRNASDELDYSLQTSRRQK